MERVSRINVIEDYDPASERSFDPLLASLIIEADHSESGELDLAPVRELAPRVRTALGEALRSLVQRLHELTQQRYFQPLRREAGADAPLWRLLEHYSANQAAMQRLEELAVPSIAHYCASDFSKTPPAFTELVEACPLDPPLKSELLEIGDAYWHGELDLAAAKGRYYRLITQLPDELYHQLVKAEMYLFGPDRTESETQHVTMIESAGRAIELALPLLGTALAGLSLPEKIAVSDSLRLEALGQGDGPRSLSHLVNLVAHAQIPRLTAALNRAEIVPEMDFSPLYTERLERGFPQLLRHVLTRLFTLKAPHLMQRIVERVHLAVRASYAARGAVEGQLAPVVGRSVLLRRLRQHAGALHPAVPVSLARRDTRAAEQRYFEGRVCSALEAILPEKSLGYTAFGLAAWGFLPDPKTQGNLHRLAQQLGPLIAPQIRSMLAQYLSDWLHGFSESRWINHSLTEWVRDSYKAREDLFEQSCCLEEELACLAEDGGPNIQYQRAVIALRYLPGLLMEEGLTTSLLAASLLQLHHLVQFRPFAKNLILHIIDEFVRSLESFSLPSAERGLSEEALDREVPILHPMPEAQDEAVMDSLALLAARLLSHGIKHMRSNSGWYSAWLYDAGQLGMQQALSRSYVKDALRPAFEGIWPLRTPQLLKSLLSSFLSADDDFAEVAP